MAIVVPSSDVQNFALQAQVTTLAAAVTANANPLVLPELQQELTAAQIQLVINLMANQSNRTPVQFGNGPSFITAAGVLNSLTINT